VLLAGGDQKASSPPQTRHGGKPLKTQDHDLGEWITGHAAWTRFVETHPELGLNTGPHAFYNMLRRHRDPLVSADALRYANGRHFIAHRERFERVLFDRITAAPTWLRQAGGAQ